MEIGTKINSMGIRISYHGLRKKLASRIEEQKRIIKGLEEAYNYTYQKERCNLKPNDFEFFD